MNSSLLAQWISRWTCLFPLTFGLACSGNGDGDITDPTGTSRFLVISAGSEYSCGIAADRSSYCWGLNFGGALGNGQTTGTVLVPAPTASPERFTHIGAGTSISCGLTVGAEAYCWGSMHAWINNTPTPLSGSPSDGWMDLSVAGARGCGVSKSGIGYCWGDNFRGRLGDGTTTSRGQATAIAGNLTFSTISAGGAHTCGITTSGDAYCWGDNAAGNLGIGSIGGIRTTPEAVVGGLRFIAISAGVWHTCAIANTGSMYCWGDNGLGSLGDGTTVRRSTPTAVPDPDGTGWAMVTAGRSHTCGITNSGAGYCWGANPDGRLGDGTTTTRHTPTLVLGGYNFRSLSAGDAQNTGNPGISHVCGVTVAGTGYCWGGNPNGALGDGTTQNRSAPVRVSL